MLDTTVMNVALPEISVAFSTSLNNLSWALNIYTILFAALTIPLTRVAEKFGMNKVIMLGFILFGIGSLISGLSNGIEILVFGRAIQSIGAALVFPLSMILGIKLVETDKRTGVIAVLGVTQGLAAALGPVIGGVITQYLTWRWIFFVNLPIVIFILIIGCNLLDFSEKNDDIHNFDILGSSLSISFLLSLTTVLTQGRNWGWASTTSLIFMFSSVVFLVSFLFVELKVEKPMIPLKLFKNRNFMGASIVIIFSNLFLVAVTVILPTYYTNVKNFDALNASFMLIPITLFIFITSPIAGFALNKVGPRILISFGFSLMMIGYIGYTYNGLNIQLYSCFYGALVGAGYGLITGPITVIAASDFTGELLSSSQSVTGVLRQIGIVLAVALFVSGLYSNLNDAQIESESYISSTVSKLNVPEEIKPHLIKKSNEGLKNQKSAKIPKRHTGNIKIDKRINKALLDIKNTAQSNVLNAFKRLYREAIPFLIVTIVLTLLFWKNKF
ncbi:MFS transporter [Leuconostoc gelidum]|nr:MFS transporter [Leuconostoc gelidum]AFS39672.1 MDR permease; transmembrane efflux protein [Leuconostoc gelidum JB7]GMA67054.1 MFS transporter [Leuconostoc gelidum subsp. gelidum]